MSRWWSALRAGFGGAFPWQANYDIADRKLNNSLITHLAAGLHDPLSPLPPPPPPDPRLPHFLGGYVYDSRSAAVSACRSAKFSGLCAKAELAGHPRCAAGWCSDWEGYWMDETVSGCGSAGYNGWSGAAGAWCCDA